MSGKLHDIKDETDVKLFVDAFYDLVTRDDLLGPVFNDIAEVDWGHHLPTMYKFWSSLLLGRQTYFGQPYPAHAALREHLTTGHFDRWLDLFLKTIDDMFAGQRADLAKARAQNIAMVFQAKMGLPGQADVALDTKAVP